MLRRPFFIYMAFRTVYIEKAVKVRLDLNNIVVNYEDDEYYINIDEIHTILFDDPRCNISLRLLSKLCEAGINVIFTDASHMPIGSLQSLYHHARAPKKIKMQMEWDKNSQIYLWTEIVKYKIQNQIETLKRKKKLDKIENLEIFRIRKELLVVFTLKNCLVILLKDLMKKLSIML